jgi:ABC-type branched-subunit amino acid transport system substrate-binding protein
MRIALAVVLAAGAALLGESLLKGGSHHSGTPAQRMARGSHAESAPGGVIGSAVAPGTANEPGAGPGGQQLSGSGSGAQAAHVAVAGGPAVTRSLRHGSMIVVIDQPASNSFPEQNRLIAQGAAVAVAELNAAGGLAHHIHIKLVPQSLDGLSPSALSARLRGEAAAVLILPCDTDSQPSLAAGAARYGILMLAPCNPDPTAGLRYPTYWPVGLGAKEEAVGLANYMRSVGHQSAFVVTAPGIHEVDLLTNYFRSAAQSRNIGIVGSTSVATTSTDFSRVAHAIEAASPKPSVIFTAVPPPLVARLAAGLRAQGVDQIVLGTSVMDTPLTLASGGQALENAAFASNGFPRSSAAAQRFAADYRRRYSRAPVGSFPGLGLETIRLLAGTTRKAGSAEPSAIQRALAGGITLSGVGLANRTYDAGGDHDPIGEIGITKISEGSLLPLLAVPSGASAP